MGSSKETPKIKIDGNVNGGIITNGNDNEIHVTQKMARKPFNDTGAFMPTVRNALFTGREDALTALATALRGEKNTIITQAVTGMGGLGKSQLALEFAYRSIKAGDFVSAHWLNLMDPAQINGEITKCGRDMGLLDDSAKQPDMVAETLRVWAKRGPRLLVLDNYESAADAMQTLAPLLTVPTLRLLITARRADFPPELGLHPYPLDVFAPSESVEFIRKLVTLRDSETPEIEKLAEKLGHLPLALHLAGHYLREEGITPAEYLSDLDEILAHESMQAAWFAQMDIQSPTRHEQSLLGTFALSWQKVTDPTAQTIFKLAGYLAPNEPIPLEIFEKTILESREQKKGNWFLNLFKKQEKRKTLDDRDIRKALSQLKMMGLFTIKEDLPTIHPLLTVYAQHLDGTPSNLLERLADQLSRLAIEANAQVDQSGSLSWFAPLQAHVQATAENAEKANLQDAASLYNSLGYHLNKLADYATARTSYECALHIRENHLGENHPKVAIVVNNLGLVLKDMGDLSSAQAAFKRALRILEGSLTKTDPKVATSVNNLGLVLLKLGDFSGARDAFERALKIDEAAFGKHHPNVAGDINNLGSVLHGMGDLSGARDAFERALKIDEAAFGKDHPNIAIDVNNLGLVLKALGDLSGARDAYECALKIDEATFGKNHPSVAIRVLNLGTVLQAQGEPTQARACYERALAIFEHFLPAGHPNIENVKDWLRSLDNLE